VNPYDYSTTGNSGIAYAYTQMFATFDQSKLQHVSSLPESIDSGTTIVCIFTNGNVSAILVTDKLDIKAKSETKTD
jgi:hypothetical protein